jgi:hypothetical protein
MNLPPKKRGQTVNADLVCTDTKHADERRKALKATGKFGLYTAPTMLALQERPRACLRSFGSRGVAMRLRPAPV